MKEPVIAIFDIGKTNKKLLLFSPDLVVVSETEQRFAEIKGDTLSQMLKKLGIK